jgi:hypothetical protein
MRAPEHIVVDAGHKDGVRMRDYGRFGLPDAAARRHAFAADRVRLPWRPRQPRRGAGPVRALSRRQPARWTAELRPRLPGWRLPDAPRQWALQVTGPVVARSEHFRFTGPFQGLEVFAKAGTNIGHHDGAGLGEAVVTPYDDCVLVMPSVRQAREGVTVVRFARRQAL